MQWLYLRVLKIAKIRIILVKSLIRPLNLLDSFPINEILKPIMLIPVTKNDKLIIQSLNMIKNLLNYGYLKDVARLRLLLT